MMVSPRIVNAPAMSSLTEPIGSRMPKVYIVIVNWNGWRDTIECLESLFRLRFSDFRVVVCDNASSDGSIEKIMSWARGALAAAARNNDLAHLTFPPVPKPIPFIQVSSDLETKCIHGDDAPLALIQAGSNLGFAGANNLGLRFAQAQNDCDFAWLLNNDTVAEPGALEALVTRMQQRPDAGICGSTLLYYDNPGCVQALGGSVYNQWTGRGGHIGLGRSRENLPSCREVEKRMKYVIGASMLIRAEFLREIGLMSEEYFLYFEEIDWAVRARHRYSLAYAPESVVYHKEGASIGTALIRAKRSRAAEYYAARSCMLFTGKHFPFARVSVAIALIARSLYRFAAGNNANGKAVLSGIRDSMGQA